MTTWIEQPITDTENFLLREEGSHLLREQGDGLLIEFSRPDWVGGSKNTASYTSPSRNTTIWSSPTKN